MTLTAFLATCRERNRAEDRGDAVAVAAAQAAIDNHVAEMAAFKLTPAGQRVFGKQATP